MFYIHLHHKSIKIAFFQQFCDRIRVTCYKIIFSHGKSLLIFTPIFVAAKCMNLGNKIDVTRIVLESHTWFFRNLILILHILHEFEGKLKRSHTQQGTLNIASQVCVCVCDWVARKFFYCMYFCFYYTLHNNVGHFHTRIVP